MIYSLRYRCARNLVSIPIPLGDDFTVHVDSVSGAILHDYLAEPKNPEAATFIFRPKPKISKDEFSFYVEDEIRRIFESVCLVLGKQINTGSPVESWSYEKQRFMRLDGYDQWITSHCLAIVTREQNPLYRFDTATIFFLAGWLSKKQLRAGRDMIATAAKVRKIVGSLGNGRRDISEAKGRDVGEEEASIPLEKARVIEQVLAWQPVVGIGNPTVLDVMKRYFSTDKPETLGLDPGEIAYYCDAWGEMRRLEQN